MHLRYTNMTSRDPPDARAEPRTSEWPRRRPSWTGRPFRTGFCAKSALPGAVVIRPVESKTRTYHGRVGAGRRAAGWRGGTGRAPGPPQVLPRSSPGPPQVLPRSSPGPPQVLPRSSPGLPQILRSPGSYYCLTIIYYIRLMILVYYVTL